MEVERKRKGKKEVAAGGGSRGAARVEEGLLVGIYGREKGGAGEAARWRPP